MNHSSEPLALNFLTPKANNEPFEVNNETTSLKKSRRYCWNKLSKKQFYLLLVCIFLIISTISVYVIAQMQLNQSKVKPLYIKMKVMKKMDGKEVIQARRLTFKDMKPKIRVKDLEFEPLSMEDVLNNAITTKEEFVSLSFDAEITSDAYFGVTILSTPLETYVKMENADYMKFPSIPLPPMQMPGRMKDQRLSLCEETLADNPEAPECSMHEFTSEELESIRALIQKVMTEEEIEMRMRAQNGVKLRIFGMTLPFSFSFERTLTVNGMNSALGKVKIENFDMSHATPSEMKFTTDATISNPSIFAFEMLPTIMKLYTNTTLDKHRKADCKELEFMGYSISPKKVLLEPGQSTTMQLVGYMTDSVNLACIEPSITRYLHNKPNHVIAEVVTNGTESHLFNAMTGGVRLNAKMDAGFMDDLMENMTVSHMFFESTPKDNEFILNANLTVGIKNIIGNASLTPRGINNMEVKMLYRNKTVGLLKANATTSVPDKKHKPFEFQLSTYGIMTVPKEKKKSQYFVNFLQELMTNQKEIEIVMESKISANVTIPIGNLTFSELYANSRLSLKGMESFSKSLARDLDLSQSTDKAMQMKSLFEIYNPSNTTISTSPLSFDCYVRNYTYIGTFMTGCSSSGSPKSTIIRPGWNSLSICGEMASNFKEEEKETIGRMLSNYLNNQTNLVTAEPSKQANKNPYLNQALQGIKLFTKFNGIATDMLENQTITTMQFMLPNTEKETINFQYDIAAQLQLRCEMLETTKGLSLAVHKIQNFNASLMYHDAIVSTLKGKGKGDGKTYPATRLMPDVSLYGEMEPNLDKREEYITFMSSLMKSTKEVQISMRAISTAYMDIGPWKDIPLIDVELATSIEIRGMEGFNRNASVSDVDMSISTADNLLFKTEYATLNPSVIGFSCLNCQLEMSFDIEYDDIKIGAVELRDFQLKKQSMNSFALYGKLHKDEEQKEVDRFHEAMQQLLTTYLAGDSLPVKACFSSGSFSSLLSESLTGLCLSIDMKGYTGDPLVKTISVGTIVASPYAQDGISIDTILNVQITNPLGPNSKFDIHSLGFQGEFQNELGEYMSEMHLQKAQMIELSGSLLSLETTAILAFSAEDYAPFSHWASRFLNGKSVIARLDGICSAMLKLPIGIYELSINLGSRRLTEIKGITLNSVDVKNVSMATSDAEYLRTTMESSIVNPSKQIGFNNLGDIQFNIYYDMASKTTSMLPIGEITARKISLPLGLKASFFADGYLQFPYEKCAAASTLASNYLSGKETTILARPSNNAMPNRPLNAAMQNLQLEASLDGIKSSIIHNIEISSISMDLSDCSKILFSAKSQIGVAQLLGPQGHMKIVDVDVDMTIRYKERILGGIKRSGISVNLVEKTNDVDVFETIINGPITVAEETFPQFVEKFFNSKESIELHITGKFNARVELSNKSFGNCILTINGIPLKTTSEPDGIRLSLSGMNGLKDASPVIESFHLDESKGDALGFNANVSLQNPSNVSIRLPEILMSAEYKQSQIAIIKLQAGSWLAANGDNDGSEFNIHGEIAVNEHTNRKHLEEVVYHYINNIASPMTTEFVASPTCKLIENGMRNLAFSIDFPPLGVPILENVEIDQISLDFTNPNCEQLPLSASSLISIYPILGEKTPLNIQKISLNVQLQDEKGDVLAKMGKSNVRHISSPRHIQAEINAAIEPTELFSTFVQEFLRSSEEIKLYLKGSADVAVLLPGLPYALTVHLPLVASEEKTESMGRRLEVGRSQLTRDGICLSFQGMNGFKDITPAVNGFTIEESTQDEIRFSANVSLLNPSAISLRLPEMVMAANFEGSKIAKINLPAKTWLHAGKHPSNFTVYGKLAVDEQTKPEDVSKVISNYLMNLPSEIDAIFISASSCKLIERGMRNLAFPVLFSTNGITLLKDVQISQIDLDFTTRNCERLPISALSVISIAPILGEKTTLDIQSMLLNVELEDAYGRKLGEMKKSILNHTVTPQQIRANINAEIEPTDGFSNFISSFIESNEKVLLLLKGTADVVVRLPGLPFAITVQVKLQLPNTNPLGNFAGIPVFLDGMDGLKATNPLITGFSIDGSNSDLIRFTADVSLSIPSNISLHLPEMAMSANFEGSKIANIRLPSGTWLRAGVPGSNITVYGELAVDEHTKEEDVSKVISNYLMNMPSSIDAVFRSAPNCRLIESGMENLAFPVIFSTTGVALLKDVEISQIELDFTTKDCTQLPISAFSVISIHPILGEKTTLDIESMRLNVQLEDINGQKLGDMKNSRIDHSVMPEEIRASINAEIEPTEGFSSFISSFIEAKEQVLLLLKGTADAVVRLPGLPFAITVQIKLELPNTKSRRLNGIPIYLDGMNGLKTTNPLITAFSIDGSNGEAVRFQANVSLINPSKISIRLPELILSALYRDSQIAKITLENGAYLREDKGASNFTVYGEVAVNDGSREEDLGQVISNFLSGIPSMVQSKVMDLGSCRIITKGMKNVALDVEVPPFGLPLLQNVEVNEITLDFSAHGCKRLPVSASSVISMYPIFGESTAIDIRSIGLDVKLIDQNDHIVGRMRKSLIDHTSTPTKVYAQIESEIEPEEESFSRFIAHFIKSKKHVALALKGAAIVDVLLPGVPFTIPVRIPLQLYSDSKKNKVAILLTFSGMDRLKSVNPALNKFTIDGSSTDALEFKADVSLSNPSDVSIRLPELTMSVEYETAPIAQIRLGAGIWLMGGKAGPSNFTVDGKLAVNSKMDKNLLEKVVQNYLSNITSLVDTTFVRSSQCPLIDNGMKGLSFPVDFPPLETSILKDIQIDDIALDFTKHNCYRVGVSASSLISIYPVLGEKAPININKMDLNLQVEDTHGKTLATISESTIRYNATPHEIHAYVNAEMNPKDDVFGSFITKFIESDKEIGVHLKGYAVVSVRLPGVQFPIDVRINLMDNLTMFFKGMNHLLDVSPKITSFLIDGSSKHALQFAANVSLENPSNISIRLPQLILGAEYKGSQIAKINLAAGTLLQPPSYGPDTFTVHGEIAVDPNTNPNSFNEIVSHYVSNIVSNIKTRFITSKQCQLINEGMENVAFAIEFPPLGSPMLKNIKMENLTVDFSQDNCEKRLPLSASSLISIHPVLGETVPINILSIKLNVDVEDSDGKALGKLGDSMIKQTATPTKIQAEIQTQILPNEVPFSNFITRFVASDDEQLLVLKGSADVVVQLPGVPFSVTVRLALHTIDSEGISMALQGFGGLDKLHPVVSGISFNRSTASSLYVDAVANLTNPSTMTLLIPQIMLDIAYQQCIIGSVMVKPMDDDLTIRLEFMKNSSLVVSGKVHPSDGCLKSFEELIAQYVNGKVSYLTGKYQSSSKCALLNRILGDFSTDVALEGYEGSLIQSINLTKTSVSNLKENSIDINAEAQTQIAELLGPNGALEVESVELDVMLLDRKEGSLLARIQGTGMECNSSTSFPLLSICFPGLRADISKTKDTFGEWTKRLIFSKHVNIFSSGRFDVDVRLPGIKKSITIKGLTLEESMTIDGMGQKNGHFNVVMETFDVPKNTEKGIEINANCLFNNPSSVIMELNELSVEVYTDDILDNGNVPKIAEIDVPTFTLLQGRNPISAHGEIRTYNEDSFNALSKFFSRYIAHEETNVRLIPHFRTAQWLSKVLSEITFTCMIPGLPKSFSLVKSIELSNKDELNITVLDQQRANQFQGTVISKIQLPVGFPMELSYIYAKKIDIVTNKNQSIGDGAISKSLCKKDCRLSNDTALKFNINVSMDVISSSQRKNWAISVANILKATPKEKTIFHTFGMLRVGVSSNLNYKDRVIEFDMPFSTFDTPSSGIQLEGLNRFQPFSVLGFQALNGDAKRLPIICRMSVCNPSSYISFKSSPVSFLVTYKDIPVAYVSAMDGFNLPKGNCSENVLRGYVDRTLPGFNEKKLEDIIANVLHGQDSSIVVRGMPSEMKVYPWNPNLYERSKKKSSRRLVVEEMDSMENHTLTAKNETINNSSTVANGNASVPNNTRGDIKNKYEVEKVGKKGMLSKLWNGVKSIPKKVSSLWKKRESKTGDTSSMDNEIKKSNKTEESKEEKDGIITSVSKKISSLWKKSEKEKAEKDESNDIKKSNKTEKSKDEKEGIITSVSKKISSLWKKSKKEKVEKDESEEEENKTMKKRHHMRKGIDKSESESLLSKTWKAIKSVPTKVASLWKKDEEKKKKQTKSEGSKNSLVNWLREKASSLGKKFGFKGKQEVPKEEPEEEVEESSEEDEFLSMRYPSLDSNYLLNDALQMVTFDSTIPYLQCPSRTPKGKPCQTVLYGTITGFTYNGFMDTLRYKSATNGCKSLVRMYNPFPKTDFYIHEWDIDGYYKDQLVGYANTSPIKGPIKGNHTLDFPLNMLGLNEYGSEEAKVAMSFDLLQNKLVMHAGTKSSVIASLGDFKMKIRFNQAVPIKCGFTSKFQQNVCSWSNIENSFLNKVSNKTANMLLTEYLEWYHRPYTIEYPIEKKDK